MNVKALDVTCPDCKAAPGRMCARAFAAASSYDYDEEQVQAIAALIHQQRAAALAEARLALIEVYATKGWSWDVSDWLHRRAEEERKRG